MTRVLKDLKTNDSGAIVVTGLFACAFLIGALWYLLGIGDAILFKERMQDGADAVAFTPSVIHARGMNLIALINISMAAVLAVLVGAKVTQALLGLATAAACAAEDYSDCAYLGDQQEPYQQFVDRVDRSVENINRSLAKTSDTIAKMMPELAARRAAAAGRAYAPMAEGAFSASISQIPEGERLGLPVEDDEYSNLCHHSGTLIDIVFIPTLAHYSDGPRMVATSMVWAGGSLAGLVAGSTGFCGGGGGNKPVSKRIYRPAKHGDDYFATWGFTTSNFIEKEDRGAKGLEVSTWKRRPAGSELSQAELDRSLRKTQVAKSEFYYDPRRGGPRGWDGIKDEALWHLRWRARLRRVSQPEGSMASTFSGAGMGRIMSAAWGPYTGEIIRNVLTASPGELAGWTTKNVGPVQSTGRTGGIVH